MANDNSYLYNRNDFAFSTPGINSTLVDEKGMDSLISAAVREHEYGGVAKQMVRQVDLRKGIGLYFRQTRVGKVEAEFVGEQSGTLKAQRYDLADLQIRTQRCQVATAITHEDELRINPEVLRQMGPGLGEALWRLEDRTILQAMSTTTKQYGSAGTIIELEDIADAFAYIAGGTGNPSKPPYHGLTRIEPYTDLVKEGGIDVLARSEISSGVSARLFESGQLGRVHGVMMAQDDYIPVDSNDDADTNIYARDAFIHVQGMMLKKWNKDIPDEDGGLTVMGCTYSFGVDSDVDFWAAKILSDAAA